MKSKVKQSKLWETEQKIGYIQYRNRSVKSPGKTNVLNPNVRTYRNEKILWCMKTGRGPVKWWDTRRINRNPPIYRLILWVNSAAVPCPSGACGFLPLSRKETFTPTSCNKKIGKKIVSMRYSRKIFSFHKQLKWDQQDSVRNTTTTKKWSLEIINSSLLQ